MHIGERIKARREELGLTQDELAKRMGYTSKSTVNKVEKGINDVTQSNIIKYADKLDTTVAYLMGWEDSLVDDKFIIEYKTADPLVKERIREYAKFVMTQFKGENNADNL